MYKEEQVTRLSPGLLEPLSNFSRKVVLGIDELIAGETEVAAQLTVPFDSDYKKSMKRSGQRIGALAANTVEILSKAATVYGLSSEAPWVEIAGVNVPIVAVIGLLSEIVANLGKNEMVNRLGSGQKTDFMKILIDVAPFMRQLHAPLVNAGFTEEQIRGMNSLPDELYNRMFGTTTRTKMEQIVKPVGTGIAMASYGNLFGGALVAGAGILGMLLGERMYQHSLRTKRQLDIGRSFSDAGFVQEIYEKEHFPRTRLTNFLTRFPAAATAVSLVLGAQEKLSNFAGFSAGLSGLADLLSTTRSKVDNTVMVSMVRKICETLKDPNYLLLPQNYRLNAEMTGTKDINLSREDFSGMAISNLSVRLPGNSSPLVENISFEIPSGEVLLIVGQSGVGKSVLFSALSRSIDGGDDAQIALVNNGHQTNLNEFANFANPIDEVQKRVVIGSVAHLNDYLQIVDLFKESFNQEYIIPEDLSAQEKTDFERGMKMANNLLEKELKIFHDPKIRGFWPFRVKEMAVFNDKIMRLLRDYHGQRRDWVGQLLRTETSGSNLSSVNINPLRVVRDISDGQKTMLMLLSKLTEVRSNPFVETVLLDEPVRGLDEGVNLGVALRLIEEIRQVRGGIAVAMISQDKLEQVQGAFESNILDLDSGVVRYFDVADINKDAPLTPYELLLNGLGIDLEVLRLADSAELWRQLSGLDPFTHEQNILFLRSMSKRSRLYSELDIVSHTSSQTLVESFGDYWKYRFNNTQIADMKPDFWRDFEKHLRLFWRYVPVLETMFDEFSADVIHEYSQNIAAKLGVDELIIKCVYSYGDGSESLIHNSSISGLVKLIGHDVVINHDRPEAMKLVGFNIMNS